MKIIVHSFLLVSMAASAGASTIYSTFGPGNSYDTVSDGSHSYDVGGGAFNGNIEDEQASSFVATGSFLLDSIRVGAYNVEGTNQLTLYLAAGGTQPGAPIETFSASNLTSTSEILTFNSTTHPLLQSGMIYWVVLTKTDLAGGADEWNWNSAGFQGRSYMLFQNGIWHANPTGLAPAFEVSGTSAVPEPGPTVLLLIGFSLAFAATKISR